MEENHLKNALADADIEGWEGDSQALSKRYVFDSFATALAFMSACREEIDKLNHHPEWTNVYNSVSVRLTTHDAGNVVTDKDIVLAKILNAKAAEF